MKIAVATVDGVSLSQHFGQSAGFVVFEVSDTDKEIRGHELRMNRHTPHAQGLCGDHHKAGHTHAEGHHGHDGVLGLLQDCAVVLCGGMGAGAATALKRGGIQPFVLPRPCSTHEAVTAFLSGELTEATAGFCGCGGH